MYRIKFPWYDHTFLRREHAQLWSRLAALLCSQGFGVGLPDQIDPTCDLDSLLASPDLLLSQTCGYDVALEHPPFAVVLTPSYAAPGCGPGTYVSVVVVREDSRVRSISDVRNARLAANDDRSWSGFHCLRDHFHRFSTCTFTGGHVESLRALAESRADVAAIDAVTWALVHREDPAALAGFRIIGRTTPAPAPPFVTARALPAPRLETLRHALRRVVETEPQLCARLLLRGFVHLPDDAYRFMAPNECSSVNTGRTYLTDRSQPELSVGLRGQTL